MMTAVQPSELVFEFASNGMDEMNQVSVTLRETLFLIFVILHITELCSTRSLFDEKLFREET